MNFLTDEQRERARGILASAPDEILLSAMVDCAAYTHRMEGAKRNLDTVLDQLAGNNVEDVLVVDTAPVERPNVNPGIALIGKIGQSAKDDILVLLSRGVQPPAKYKEHMKLLWSRKEIKFDGAQFYL